MADFKDMPAIDRRRFIAGFLATAASAGVLGKLGISQQQTTLDIQRGPDAGVWGYPLKYNWMWTDGQA